jgi:prepilin-type processing-associated H-X9-DG protein
MGWPCGEAVPIACEPLANHAGDGMNILFGDGHVEFLPAAAAERAMRGPPATRPAQQVAGN